MKISEYMTKSLCMTDPDTSVYELLEFLEDDTIRHMPVIENKKPVGIISDRDLKYFQNKEWAKKLIAKDVMTEHPYVVNSNEELSNVLEVMEKKKIGSTLVCDDSEQLIGIFTTTDALSLLRKHLN